MIKVSHVVVHLNKAKLQFGNENKIMLPEQDKNILENREPIRCDMTSRRDCRKFKSIEKALRKHGIDE